MAVTVPLESLSQDQDGWVEAGLESASPLPFEMKKTASVSKLLDKNCTFVNGGLWLVKKINVFFLTSLFLSSKQQIYYNYQLNGDPWHCHAITRPLQCLD